LSPDGTTLISYDTRNQRFYVTDRDFHLKTSFTHPDFDSIWGFCITTDNRIVVPNNRYSRVTFSYEEKKQFGVAELLFFDLKGTLLHRLSWEGETGPLVYPSEIIEFQPDVFYVTDLRLNSIIILTATGEKKGAFGGLGDAPGEIYYPSDLAKTPDGNILVADCFNSRLQLFDSTGKFLRLIADSGTGDGQVRFPEYLSLTREGGFFCTEYGTMRVSEFDRDYTFVRNWYPRHESSSDELYELYGVQVLEDPRQILVADSRNGLILRLSDQGKLLATHSGPVTGQEPKPQ
jgi:WD40 repeat protein